ncbi:PepSY domain-containing protein [Rhodobacter sp. NSM]|uniref:PepSY domain-containing protein n=1 Tax=Rhodobacter sp. NSM TaxID=3457501 RepID=UPI003FD2A5DD
MRLILLSLLLLPSAAGSQDAVPIPLPDFEAARRGVEQGEMLPLGSLMPRIEQEFGRVLEVELEEADEGGMVYEFEILRPDGRLVEVDVDVVTGLVVEVEDEEDDDDDDGMD